MQISARQALPYTDELGDTFLKSTVHGLKSLHPTFELMYATLGGTFAGYKSVSLCGTLKLLIFPEDEEIEIAVLSRSYTIFAPQATFTIVLSGSADPEYFDEGDFNAILQSIKVDA